MAMATEDFQTHHHDGNSLIVGFPPVPRQRGEPRRHHDHAVSVSHDSTSAAIEVWKATINRPKAKSVSFSAKSKMIVIPFKSDQELASAWYSEEDKNHQKRMVLRNAAEVSRMLETGPDQLTEEDFCKTVGMANYMSARVMWLVKLEKRRHTRSIVAAQAMLDPTLLSRLSKRSSLPARQNAYERATLNQF